MKKDVFNTIENLHNRILRAMTFPTDAFSGLTRLISSPSLKNIRKNKLTILALEKANSDLVKIIDSSPEIICTIDKAGIFIRVSAATEKIWGYTPEELIGKPYLNFVYKEDTAKTVEADIEIEGGVDMTNFENRYVRKDGSLVPMVWSARWDEADQLVYCVAKDATEKKKAEEKIKNSEEKYRVLYFSSPIPKLIFNLHTFYILDVNDAAIAHYGYSRKEFLCKSIVEIGSKEDILRLGHIFQHVNQGGSNDFGIFKHQKKDGTKIQVEISGSLFKYEEENCIMIQCVDVTARESALMELEDQKAKLEHAQQIARLGNWQLYPHNSTIYWSTEVYNIWGMKKEDELNFESLMSTIHPDDIERFTARQVATLNGEEDLDIEHRIILPDGSVKWVHEKGKLVNNEDGTPVVLEGTVQDVTERVKYQEQLIEAKQVAENAEKQQELFLANMSHEIRTPMNGIQGMTDLLLETVLDEEQQGFGKTIKRSVDNLLVIINDILDFSKIKAGKLSIESIDFSLYDVLENIKAIFKHRINKKKLSLELNINEDVPDALKGDPYRLNQILVNLVGNAVKFTKSGGISIGISVKEKTAKEIILNFAIADTGIGIEADKIDDIFESFTQASVNTTRMYGGTGLGLAITKRLIELQQGAISVESEINIGTTFSFFICYKYSKPAKPIIFQGSDLKKHRSLLINRKFLIAEDNEVNQDVIRHVIQKAGGIAHIANNGAEAVNLIKEMPDYDMVLMDLQMPEMDGYAATKYIRNVLHLPIPIIAMTATALRGEKEKCLEIGMNDYISKPFDFSVLYNRIGILLGETPVKDTVAAIEKSGNKPLFDLSLLKEMDDNEYTAKILVMLLQSIPVQLTALHTACTAHQFKNVCKLAHKLKSSVGLLKASFVLDILNQIEEKATAGDGKELAELIELAIEKYKELETPIKEVLKDISPKLSITV